MGDAVLTRAGPLAVETPVAITLLAPVTRLSARGGPEAARRFAETFGVELSQVPLRACEVGARATLWLGPDEWLLLSPEHAGLASAIEAGLSGEPGCIVDISHRQAAIEIAGPGAAATLNAGCPLDLDAKAFPVGMATRTCLAKADIVLWRRGVERFYVEVWRSFAPYVFAFLQQAAIDHVA